MKTSHQSDIDRLSVGVEFQEVNQAKLRQEVKGDAFYVGNGGKVSLRSRELNGRVSHSDDWGWDGGGNTFMQIRHQVQSLWGSSIFAGWDRRGRVQNDESAVSFISVPDHHRVL